MEFNNKSNHSSINYASLGSSDEGIQRETEESGFSGFANKMK